MYKAVDTFFDADKDTEVGDVPNSTLDDGSDWVCLLDDVPRVGLELTHAQADPLVLDIDTQNLGLDNRSHLDELGRVLDALVPGHL